MQATSKNVDRSYSAREELQVRENRVEAVTRQERLEQAEIELYGVIDRFRVHYSDMNDFAMYVVLQEYERLKKLENPDWNPPAVRQGG